MRAAFRVGRLAGAALLGALLAPACNKQSVSPSSLASLRVLFIGNSLTYVNDLPGTIAAMAASIGDTIFAQAVALPNYALIDHVDGQSNAVQVIRKGGWDYVIMQQGPTSLTLDRDTLVLAARRFDPHIRAVGAIPGLYMVWPASNRLAFWDAVRTSYQLAAEEVGGVFMPAGEAWRTAWAENPQLPLYGGDGFHPSALGTYLAALVIYEHVTGKDARGLPGRVIVSGQSVSASEATVRQLQRIAHETNARFAPARR